MGHKYFYQILQWPEIFIEEYIPLQKKGKVVLRHHCLAREGDSYTKIISVQLISMIRLF